MDRSEGIIYITLAILAIFIFGSLFYFSYASLECRRDMALKQPTRSTTEIAAICN